jgi:hypothetical protein
MTVKVNSYLENSFLSVIFTIILYVLIYSIDVGYIIRLDFYKVMKMGRPPVAESSTAEMLV